MALFTVLGIDLYLYKCISSYQCMHRFTFGVINSFSVNHRLYTDQYFAHEQSQDCPDLWFAHEQSEDCAVNPWFVVQTMDPRFAQDNPWIAQIHASRITYTCSNCLHC